MFGSFFDCLLKLIILVYAKRLPKCARISKQKLTAQNLIDWFFFLTLTVRGPFYRKDFKWKKWGYGVNFWKNGSFVYRTLQNLHHRYFLMILILLTEQLYWRKIFCGCFRFIWQWLLIAIIKSCAERSALQLYRISLILPWCHDCNLSSNERKPLQTFFIFLCCKQQKSFWKNVGSLAFFFFFLRFQYNILHCKRQKSVVSGPWVLVTSFQATSYRATITCQCKRNLSD